MLKAYLFLIEEAVLFFFVLAIILLIPICIVHYRVFGYLRPTKALVFYSFLLYSLCAVFVVVFPLTKITDDFCATHTLARQIQLTPFKFIGDIWQKNHISIRHFNLISIIKSQVFLQAFLNFLLLMPLGFYLHYYFRTSFKVAAIISIATTASFEITQITGIYGVYPCPHRFFDVDDLILNSSGSMVGYLIMPLFWFLPNLQKKPKTPPKIVTPLRRLVAFFIDWFLANTVVKFILSFEDLNLTKSAQILLYFMIYFIWFILIPYFWNGKTLGKNLVVIHLIPINSKSIGFLQLLTRYGLLIFIPVVTELLVYNEFIQKPGQLSALDRFLELIFIGLFVLEFLLLFGLVFVRRDSRGIHELLSQTKNAIKINRENYKS